MAQVPPPFQPTRVLVLGAGFAGLELCKTLRDPSVAITLLDRQNHFLFQPLLYQVATASLTAPDIAAPIREVLADRKNVSVMMEEVLSIDLEKRLVVSKNSHYSYDYLVIGLGVKTGYFGHDTWAANAPGLKSLSDARHLRHRVLRALERAELSEDAQERRRLLTIAIVGGGPTGVELAGAFTELIHRVLRDGFRRVQPADLRVLLIEGGDRVLAMFHPKQSDYTLQRLEGLGIEVRIKAMVSDVRPGALRVDGEWIEAETVIWAAGTEANPLTKDLPVAKDRQGRLLVLPDCSLPGYPCVFAVGDIAHCVDRHGVTVPALGAAAMQMGKHVARLIEEELRVKRGPQRTHAPLLRRQFGYFDKGIMAIVGKSAAVVKARQFHLDGFFAWLAWLFVHLLLLVGFRNKAAVLLQWGFAYLRGRRSARIITAEE